MNLKIVKILIAAFSLIVVAFLVLIAVNYRYSGGQARQSAPASGERLFVRVPGGAGAGAGSLPSYRPGLSGENAGKPAAIMPVKSREFESVAEEPQNVMDVLAEMSGSNKKKPAAVNLTEGDLKKKILVPGSGPKEPARGSYAVPKLGESGYARMGVLNMIKAPVDFKVFRTSETWSAFASFHKGRFPAADFSREQMIILVSVSELPSGIFKITGVKKAADRIRVQYRVDPLVMSSESKSGEYAFYSAAVIPKTDLPVRLEQVP